MGVGAFKRIVSNYEYTDMLRLCSVFLEKSSFNKRVFIKDKF